MSRRIRRRRDGRQPYRRDVARGREAMPVCSPRSTMGVRGACRRMGRHGSARMTSGSSCPTFAPCTRGRRTRWCGDAADRRTRRGLTRGRYSCPGPCGPGRWACGAGMDLRSGRRAARRWRQARRSTWLGGPLGHNLNSFPGARRGRTARVNARSRPCAARPSCRRVEGRAHLSDPRSSGGVELRRAQRRERGHPAPFPLVTVSRIRARVSAPPMCERVGPAAPSAPANR